MLLAHKLHTVGDRRQYTVDYFQWLATGATIAAGTATTTSLTASVDTVTHTTTTLAFFVNGGVLNEVFTVALQITDSTSEVKNDTIEVVVVAP